MPTMNPSKKKNKENNGFLIDCHRECLGVGGAGQALIFPRTGLVIDFPEASSGTPVLGSNLQSLEGLPDFLSLAKSIDSSSMVSKSSTFACSKYS